LKVAIAPEAFRLLLNPEVFVLLLVELEPEDPELPLLPVLELLEKVVAPSVRLGPYPGARALVA
jgi:hypothetical protein